MPRARRAQPLGDRGRTPAKPAAAPVYRRDGFLAPFAMAKVVSALDRLSASWKPSEALGLLGRGGTTQVRSTDIAIQSLLDEVRLTLGPAVLDWSRACGFAFRRAPFMTLFPVRMIGDAQAPAYQEPHVDSSEGMPGPPVCTNVFYAQVKDVVGGELAVARGSGDNLDDPIVVRPTANTVVSFRGDRVHWVRPLEAGERLSVVVNLF